MFRKNIESKNSNSGKTKNRKIMLLLKCEVRDCKKSRFIKEQEGSRLLNSFVINTPLSKIALVGTLLF